MVTMQFKTKEKLIAFLLESGISNDILKGATDDELQRIQEHVKKKIKQVRAEKEKLLKTEGVSCYVDDDGDVVEEILKEDGSVGFVCWKENDSMIAYPSDKFSPINDEMLKKKVVMLSTGIEEYDNEEKLMAELKIHMEKYVDVEGDFLEQAVFYILLSWVYDRLNTVPYLRALGDTGTGKSRFLDVIGSLCYKPMKITGAASPAAIFRIIEKWKGTLIIEEADRKQSDTSDDVVKILNCGYERDNPVVRCDKDDPNDIRVHDVFGPKVISSRKTFYDKALESRCITYVTRETKRSDIPPLLPPSFFVNNMILRNKLLLWRLKNWKRIDVNVLEEPEKFGLSGIEPRLKQTAMPFLVLFTNEALRKKFIEFIKTYQIILIDERSESDEGLLVNAYKNLVENGQEKITATDIMNFVNEELKDKNKWSKRKVGGLLRSIGFLSTVKTISGESIRLVEISDEQYDTLLNRYNSEYFTKKITEVTEITDITNTPKNKKNVLNSANEDVDGVSVCNVISVTSVTDEKEETNKKPIKKDGLNIEELDLENREE